MELWPRVEANHKSYRDDELAKAGTKRVDLETQVATHSSKLEAVVSKSSVLDGEVAELHVDLCVLLAHQLETDAMRVDEREISATTKEDLEQVMDVPVPNRSRRWLIAQCPCRR